MSSLRLNILACVHRDVKFCFRTWWDVAMSKVNSLLLVFVRLVAEQCAHVWTGIRSAVQTLVWRSDGCYWDGGFDCSVQCMFTILITIKNSEMNVRMSTVRTVYNDQSNSGYSGRSMICITTLPSTTPGTWTTATTTTTTTTTTTPAFLCEYFLCKSLSYLCSLVNIYLRWKRISNWMRNKKIKAKDTSR